MSAIDDLARARRGAPTTSTTTWRATVIEVHANNMVHVRIPRYAEAQAIGPIPSAVTNLQIGQQVIVSSIGGRATEMMVLSTADGSTNWLQLPDLSIVPVDGADMDLFYTKAVALVPDEAAVGGLHFPAPVGGLAESWGRATGEQFQRYTTFDGRTFARSRTYPDLWGGWFSPLVDPDDIAGATTVGKALLTAATTADARTAIALGNVNNTADTAKPVSTAQQTALNLKANLNSPTFTGTVGGITKAMVGLGSVDNTSDLAKPVSTATASALSGKEDTVAPGTTAQFYRGDKTWAALTKSDVGLGNVDNTSDLAKPVSTAMTTALNGKAATTHAHAAGDITSGTLAPALLPAVTTSVNGAMIAADKAKLDNAVSASTASRLMIRDSAGRASVADPSAASDIATKSYVDNADLQDGFGAVAVVPSSTSAPIDTTETLISEATFNMVAGNRYLISLLAHEIFPNTVGQSMAFKLSLRIGGTGVSGTFQQGIGVWPEPQSTQTDPDSKVFNFIYTPVSSGSTRVSITALKTQGTSLGVMRQRYFIAQDLGFNI